MRTLVARLMFVCTALVVCTTEAAPNALSPDQAAAEAAFRQETRTYLDKANVQCGTALTLTTDFESFDAAAWKAKGASKSYSGGIAPEGVCDIVLDGLAFTCRAGDKDQPLRPAISKDLKSVACLVSGAQPRSQEDGGGDDPFVKRNMSYANGVFTVHMDPTMVNVDTNMREILYRGLAHSSVAPKMRKDTSLHDNGDPCTSRAGCQSGVCTGGVCRGCGPGRACATGYFCDNQICWSEAAAKAREACAKSGRSPYSASCNRDSQCCSGRCEWSPAFEEKRCK